MNYICIQFSPCHKTKIRIRIFYHFLACQVEGYGEVITFTFVWKKCSVFVMIVYKL